MSNVYISEPATAGRVIFETTHGPLDMQLWCRECPETTRFFLQLCMDGFYDNMVFHRIMPNFLVQTGALREPKVDVNEKEMQSYRTAVQANKALERRKFEVHSRIRFNHRGQVAMALGVNDEDGDDEEIHPQFFVTLDEASHLDGKHVLFGTVAGPTVFNALRIGQVEVDESTHQPAGDVAHAPRIVSVKIVENPLHISLTPQPKVPWRVQKDPAVKRKKKRKGKRDLNVLSFGDEMEDDGTDLVGVKSSHDVLNSKTLSTDVDAKVKDAVIHDDYDSQKPEREYVDQKNGGESRGSQIPALGVKTTGDVNNKSTTGQLQESKARDGESPKPEPLSYKKTRKEAPKPAAEVVVRDEQPTEEEKAPRDSVLEARRSKYIKGRKSKKQRESETVQKLFAFRDKVRTAKQNEQSEDASSEQDTSLAARMARRVDGSSQQSTDDNQETYHGQVLENDNEEMSNDWLHTKFKCRRHMDREAGDGRHMDDYEVVDGQKSERDESRKSHRKEHRKLRRSRR